MTNRYAKHPPILDPLNARLVEQVMAFWNGEHEEVVRWLCTLGCRVTHHEGGEYAILGTSGITCGLVYPAGDPTTVLVQFGFLLAGMHWTKVFAPAQAGVNWQWSREAKAERGASA